MKYLDIVPGLTLVLIIALSLMLTSQSSFANQNYAIPSWIKNNAKWWSNGAIGDSDFVKGIQYLIEKGIMTLPPTAVSSTSPTTIPVWVKNDAKWWSGGQIGDSEFVKGMQYLVQVGIIQIRVVQEVNQTNMLPQPANQTNMLSQPTNQTENGSSIVPTSCTAVGNGVLPDPNCTPGAVDQRVTQDNIDSTICVDGYASSVRPPVSYTEPLKLKLMEAYGYTDSASNYELDHLIPLELGGAPSDVKNLWPESHNTNPNSYDKDGFENYLHEQVCSGNMALHTAQNEISSDWVQHLDDLNH